MKYETLKEAADYFSKSREWQKAFDLAFYAQLTTINEQQDQIEELEDQNSKLKADNEFYRNQVNLKINQIKGMYTIFDRDNNENRKLIADISEALQDPTLNSLYQVSTGIRDLQAKLDAIKKERDSLLFLKTMIRITV